MSSVCSIHIVTCSLAISFYTVDNNQRLFVRRKCKTNVRYFNLSRMAINSKSKTTVVSLHLLVSLRLLKDPPLPHNYTKYTLHMYSLLSEPTVCDEMTAMLSTCSAYLYILARSFLGQERRHSFSEPAEPQQVSQSKSLPITAIPIPQLLY